MTVSWNRAAPTSVEELVPVRKTHVRAVTRENAEVIHILSGALEAVGRRLFPRRFRALPMQRQAKQVEHATARLNSALVIRGPRFKATEDRVTSSEREEGKSRAGLLLFVSLRYFRR